MEKSKPGKLYLVATPIGNLEDITLRALRVLREVDLIACEDTRTTRKLLSAHGMRTSLLSYHEQGGKGKGERIVRKLLLGKNVALVSEAGSPGISDPGHELVQLCLGAGIEPLVVPGPSALLAAISGSGLPVDRFAFEGFLPRKRAERIRCLEGLRADARTLVFFESPRRLAGSLADMAKVLGDRKAVLARELTKTFEEFRRGSLSELVAWTQGQEVRGEITVLVAGQEAEAPSEDALRSRIHFLKERGKLGDREIVRVIHEEMGLPSKVVYRAILEQAKEGGGG